MLCCSLSLNISATWCSLSAQAKSSQQHITCRMHDMAMREGQKRLADVSNWWEIGERAELMSGPMWAYRV